MLKYAKFLSIFLLLLCFSLAEVKAEQVLTWEDCVGLAKKNNPDLVSAGEKLNQAEFNKKITISNILPQISGSLSARTSKAENSQQSESYSYSISGRQLLFDGSKTSNNIKIATEKVKTAEYNYNLTSANIRLKLRTAFVKLLKTQELLNITEDIAQRRRKNVELVQLRYEAGREHKGSLLTAQANLSQAEFEVAQAKRNLILAQRQLSNELGQTELKPVIVKGDFNIKYPDREKPDFERLTESTSLLKELISQTESARLSVKLAKADFIPQISANASTGGSASDWPPDESQWSAGVSLSLPLFEGGSRIAAISKAKSVFEQAQTDQRSGRMDVILTLEETWIQLQNAIDKIKVEQKFLEAVEERAKISHAQYSTGLISFDNWTIIEDNLVRAKKSFLDVQTNALIAEANWIQTKGGTLDEE